ncbi:methyl-accepting chemotaxis protein [Solibacillus silvestris]|uniref:methyl-accepting chemotaxis protein n=1 Tax=Solibacillus silvestris TaxID=76853 RepID=UPI003F7DE032
MTSTTEVSFDPFLQHIIQFAPMLKKLFTADVLISISDLEKVVMQIESKEINSGNGENRLLTPQDPMLQVMKNNRAQTLDIPKEYYGMDLKIAFVPLVNGAGKVVGCLAVSTSVQNRADLVDIADKFAVSSEEIGASTVELSSSAENLSEYMQNISKAQENLTHQVNDSAKILEMINTVAKSTRILGFNAGIEAARSGEHGKGFSVVAKEITKLADQSGEAVNEIRQLLEAMKNKVAEVSQSVESTMHITDAQSNAIHEISNSIKQLTEVAEKIDELAQKI